LLRRLTLLAVCLASAGCMKDYLARFRGTGFDDRTKELTAEIPQRAKEGKPFTFSTKAQEIEKNFGFE
jgi:hypothetical protein